MSYSDGHGSSDCCDNNLAHRRWIKESIVVAVAGYDEVTRITAMPKYAHDGVTEISDPPSKPEADKPGLGWLARCTEINIALSNCVQVMTVQVMTV